MAPSDISPRPAVMAVSACEAGGEVVGSTDSATECWCDGDWAYAGIIVSAQTGLSPRVSVACIHTDYKDRTCEAEAESREGGEGRSVVVPLMQLNRNGDLWVAWCGCLGRVPFCLGRATVGHEGAHRQHGLLCYDRCKSSRDGVVQAAQRFRRHVQTSTGKCFSAWWIHGSERDQGGVLHGCAEGGVSDD